MSIGRMIRTVVCAVAASTAAAVLSAPASAGTVHRSAADAVNLRSAAALLVPRPDLSGLRMQSPHTAPIYLIDPEGYRRWIPNPATYDALFRDWGGVVSDLGTNQISARPALDNGAFLARAPGTAPVYLISNGVKRWIVYATTMDKYWFDWAKVHDLSAGALNSIPSGPNWT